MKTFAGMWKKYGLQLTFGELITKVDADRAGAPATSIRVVPIDHLTSPRNWIALYVAGGQYLVTNSAGEPLGLFIPMPDYIQLGTEKAVKDMTYAEVDRIARGDEIERKPITRETTNGENQSRGTAYRPTKNVGR